MATSPFPIIDYQSEHAARDFTHSLHQTGFAVLANHPIPSERINAIYTHWKGFFNNEFSQQGHSKHDYRFTDKMDGYFPSDVSETAKGESFKDIKEYFHFYHPWGQCPEELQDELIQYRQLANTLATELLTWVERQTPASVAEGYHEPLSHMIEGSDQTLLRILHYPPLSGQEPVGAVRAAAHEDINLLTILPAANEPGLQVQLKDGTWFDIPYDFGHLIINTGDMLQEASSGYFPSTTHRVLNPSPEQNTSRISIPLFLHPRPDVQLSKRYTAGEYLNERLKELGVK